MEDQNTHQEPPIQQPPAVVTNPSRRIHPMLMGIGVILLIGIGLLGGYFLFSPKTTTAPNSNQLTQTPPTVTTEQSPTNIVNPTSSTSNWKSHTTTQLQDISFKPYTILHPETWIKEVKRSNDTDTLTLTKEDHHLVIYQAAYGGGGCIFEGEVPEGPYEDLRDKKYVEIQSGIGTLRRFAMDIKNGEFISTIYSFCQKNSSYFASPTTVGQITYRVPATIKNELLLEMDSIIKTLSVIN